MKRIILLAAFAALCLVGNTADAAHIHFEKSYDGPWEWDEITMTTWTNGSSTYYKGTARITGYSGSDTELVIPSKIIWNYDVTGPSDYSTHFEYEVDVVEIYDRAFHGNWGNHSAHNRALVSVTIPDGVTNIGNDAFCYCSSLTTVTIPESVTSLGNDAFCYCSSLTSVTIPDSVTSIGSGAFSHCSGLTSVTIPNSVTNIGTHMFYACSSLTSVTIPNSVTSIGMYMFFTCSSLASVTIPDSVTSIGENAFYHCYNLESVTIGSGVQSIGDYAFNGCVRLVDVYYQSDVSGWCSIDFANSSSGVYAQQSSPFEYASNFYIDGQLVTSLVIPDGVKNIPNYAFYNCDCLQSVYIPDSVTNIGTSAFASCDNITRVRASQYVMAQGVSAVFPGSYQELRCLRLSSDVTAIRDDEFHNFRALEQIEVEDENLSFLVAGAGCLYTTDMTTLVACPRNATDVVIPISVTRIYDYALDGCGMLWAKWYGTLSALAANGGGAQSGGTAAEATDPRYALGDAVADRAIATVTVDGDSAIDGFVLSDGKVFDTVLRVINVSDGPSTLTLPSGYAYERLKGTAPLTIPALSTNLLTITRTADRVFFVAREELELAQ